MKEPDIGQETEEYMAMLREDRIDGERAAAFFLGMVGEDGIDPEVAVEVTCSWVSAIATGSSEDNQEWRE